MKFNTVVRMTYELHDREKELNKDLLYNNRKDELYPYIMEVLKQYERVDYIKILDYEFITDETKINPYKINPKYLKVAVDYERYLPISDNRYDLLKVKYQINFKGKESTYTNNLLLPKRHKHCYFVLGGNKFYPIYQMVDSSTYNNTNCIIMKPMTLRRKKQKLIDIQGEEHTCIQYILHVFGKVLNPLVMYLSPVGLDNTIIYFKLDDIVKIRKIDEECELEDDHYSFAVNDHIVDVLSFFYDQDVFTQSFTYNIIEIMNISYKMYNTKLTPMKENWNDPKFWTQYLGSIFTENDDTMFEKGRSVLISFKEIAASDIYKQNIRTDYVNKKSTQAILRWMMRNFQELKIKNNFDLKHKRLRLNEYIADYFSKKVSNKLNRFLSIQEKKLEIDDIETLLNLQSTSVIKAMLSAKSPLVRYDNSVNDMDFFTAFKYSVKGPSSLGSNKCIPMAYKTIQPSHVGIIDVNGTSGSDPGVTGYLTPFAETYEGKFFSTEAEPQDGIENFEKMYNAYFHGEKTCYSTMKELNKQEKVSRKFLKRMNDIDAYINDLELNNDNLPKEIIYSPDINTLVTIEPDEESKEKVKKKLFKNK